MVVEGRKQLADLKFTDEEKRKDFTETLDKMDKMLKEMDVQLKTDVKPDKPEELKK